MVIYIDIYFFKNIIFNFMLIYLTSFLIRKKTKIYKILIASCIGAIYAILALYSKNIFNSIILKIIISVTMLAISFGVKELVKMTSSFFVVAYIVAGIIASLLKVNNQVVLLLFAVFTMAIFYLYKKNQKYNELYDIEMQISQNEINLVAKLDTGNELKDSIFGDPVIVVSEEKVKNQINSELLKILNNERIEVPDTYKNKIKLISFNTISDEGIKTGIKLDKTFIYIKDKKIETNAIMILANRNFKGYDALIGKNFIEGGYEYEDNSFNKIKNQRVI